MLRNVYVCAPCADRGKKEKLFVVNENRGMNSVKERVRHEKEGKWVKDKCRIKNGALICIQMNVTTTI